LFFFVLFDRSIGRQFFFFFFFFTLHFCFILLADGDNVVLDSFAPSVAAALLKKWLFNMRAPLVPPRYTELFISTSQLEKPIQRLANIRKAMPLLPRANYIMLERLACLFHLVAESGTGNTAEELAALFALVLIWPPASADHSADADADHPPAQQSSQSGRNAELLLTVSVPSMQMSSKMRFTPSMTAADALDVIYKKVRKLDANLQYRLWLPPPKNILAEPDAVLQQFALRDGDVIVVKQQGAAVPPYYQMAAADLWLAFIEEYRFLFANGAARFTAAVHRVPVAHGVHSSGSVGGFRRRDVITAETLESEIDSALSSQAADGGAGGGGGGGGGALSPNLRRPRQQPAAQQAPPARLMSAPSIGFSQLSPRGMTMSTNAEDVGQGFNPLLNDEPSPAPAAAAVAAAATRQAAPVPYTQQDFLDLQFAFGGLDDDVLRDALTQCGSLRAATEFLQSQSDEVDAQRVLYNTMQLDVNHRPAPPLPKGATPHASALSSSSAAPFPSVVSPVVPAGAHSASSFGHVVPLSGSPNLQSDSPTGTIRQRPAVPEKPAYLSKNASMPVVPVRSSSPDVSLRSSSGQLATSSPSSTPTARRPELGMNASKPDLFKEIAYLNGEIRRLTAENRELVSGMDANAAMKTLQTQIDDMSAQLDEVKERCTCGAARYRMVK
jgi:hypothetical protein